MYGGTGHDGLTPPRLVEPPVGDSLDVVPPMDFNELLQLQRPAKAQSWEVA